MELLIGSGLGFKIEVVEFCVGRGSERLGCESVPRIKLDSKRSNEAQSKDELL